MKKHIAAISVISSIPCAIVCAIYTILPEPMNGLIWCMFLGYFPTFAKGAEVKQLPNYLCSITAGVVWSIIYHYFFLFLLVSLGLSLTASMFLDVFVITALLMFVHIALLGNTRFNIIPLMFPPIASIFATGNPSFVPYCAISIVIGCLLATYNDSICNFVLRSKLATNRDEAKATE